MPTLGPDFSPTAFTLISIAVVGGITTAFLLYKAAHAKKEITAGSVSETQRVVVDPGVIASNIRSKVEKIPLISGNHETAVRDISKIIEEETQNAVKDLRQEYSVKYQVALQEKNREVDSVRKEYSSVKEKYETVEKLYQKADGEKKTTEAVVRSIAEGLVVVNQSGEVLLMNPSAEKILGIQKEKKIGKPIAEDLRDEILLSLTKDGGDGAEKIVEYKSKDENMKRVIRSSSAVIQNEQGQTIGMVNILTDVTKQRELDEIKGKFVSNITHELRTPIVAMQKAIMILQTPQAGSLNEAQKNFLNIVGRNLNQLNRLVEDLLDIAKIDSGKMKIRATLGKLDKVIRDACDTLDTWAKSKGVQIVRDLDRNLPEMNFDPDKITQVLNNFLSNAIKFTPTGGTITVKSLWRDRDSAAEVSVSDTGVGISQEDLPKLFSRFEQFGDQVGISGTGLGLCIAKEIVERHGGQVSAESVLKKGSKFTFTVPLKIPAGQGGV